MRTATERMLVMMPRTQTVVTATPFKGTVYKKMKIGVQNYIITWALIKENIVSS